MHAFPKTFVLKCFYTDWIVEHISIKFCFKMNRDSGDAFTYNKVPDRLIKRNNLMLNILRNVLLF